jgi:hypothetical protein
VGLPSENVEFVEKISGLDGKGYVAARLGLSFFVDDTGEVLESVFADKTNSSDFIKRFDGILFHFASSGRHRWKTKPRENMSAKFWYHYSAVTKWSEVLECLGIVSASSLQVEESWMLQRKRQCPSEATELVVSRPTAFTKELSTLVNRIDVNIEDDASFGVVKRLTGPDNEYFRYIANESGAKILLNGKGSPHPQAQRSEQEPLTICIRAKTSKCLQEAVALAEELLHDVRLEYQKFNDS